MKKLLGLLLGLLAALGAAMAALVLRYRRDEQRADTAWASADTEPLKLDPVERLTITPLVDKRVAHANLNGGLGVSYLIQAGGARLLFDLGVDATNGADSLLQRNASQLGLPLDPLDALVISHRHYDHVGGFEVQRAHSFATPTPTIESGKVPVFLPEPLQHPTADLRVVTEPQPIVPGVVSLGTIPGALFFLGWTPEQALAVNVTGKGIVIIVGCGHQGIHRIVERAEALFDAPVHAIVGGLHLPVTGVSLRRFVGTGRLPWRPLTPADTRETIRYLQDKGIKRIALSAHDSCDRTVNAFQEAWGADFDVVTVGQPLTFASNGNT
jgi:7,8-dihydropterin-6-yl-methyl-4-(beta-D-ribofuranosyl)aminobenzene 5'-phosphate synthase